MLHRKVKHGDKITIGESEVHVRKVKGGVILSIKAPKEVAIEHREGEGNNHKTNRKCHLSS